MSYGYKRSTTEQLQNSVIDWAGITKQVSDRITKEQDRRENLKAELETTYNNQLDALNDYQQGLDVEANAFMMQQIQNHKAFLKQNHDLMKAGLRSVNDNKLIQTNVSNTWKRLNSAMKGHQEAFQKFSESGKTGDLALAEFLADSINVKDKQIYLSETGEGYLAAVDDKGVIDKSSLQAIRSIEQVQASEWDSIDVNAAVLKDANGAAIWKEAFATMDIEDVRQNPEFKEWKENTITKSLNNDQRLFSVLTDYMGYDYTYNPDEVDENTVLLKKDKNNGFPTPELSPEQKQKAREAYGNALEMALGRKETYKAPKTYKPSDSEKKRQKDASSLYDISTRMIQGDSTAFGQVEGQKYITTDAEGKVKTIILGEPKLLDDTIVFYDQNQNVVTSVDITGDSMRDALNVAQVIRSGEKSDQVQSLFDQGAQQAGGKLPELRGEKLEAGATVSIIDEMPQSQTSAKTYLESYPEITRVFDVETSGYINDFITLTDKATGEKQEFNTETEKEKLKAFLANYGIKLKTAKQERPAGEVEGGETKDFG